MRKRKNGGGGKKKNFKKGGDKTSSVSLIGSMGVHDGYHNDTRRFCYQEVMENRKNGR